MYHRRPGSMGPTTSPGRVFPGKKLPGHMGKDTVTVQNLEVVKVDMDKNVILIKGSVPGYKNSLVKIRDAARTAVAKSAK
jgi:large subunit ribosomal protein L3